MTDFRIAFRSLLRRPGYTAVIVGTLAVVIGCNTAIFSLLDAVLLRPLAYADPDRLVMLFEANRAQGQEQVSVSAPTMLDWKERSRSFESMAAYRYVGHTLNRTDGEPERITSVEASPALFPLLGVQPVLGRAFLDTEATPGRESVVLLSHSAWAGRFGRDPNVLSSTIHLNGQPFTVVGVMPPGFQFPPADATVDAWLPLPMMLDFQRPRVHRLYQVIARLAASATPAQAQDELERVSRDIATENPDSHRGWGVTLVGVHDRLVGDVKTTLWMLFAATSLVLLIGCANVANLVLARSAESMREFAIRSSLGARASALLRLSVAEGLILSTAGGLASVWVSGWGVAALKNLIPPNVPRAGEITVDLTVLAFTAAVSLATGIVFGLVPALRILNPNLIAILHGSRRGASAGPGAQRLNHLMIAGEVALALVLLVGAGLMVGSLLRLLDTDPGFRKSEVVSVVVSLPRSRYPQRPQQQQFYTDLIERLSAAPEVKMAAAVSDLPMSPVGIDFNLPFTPPGQTIASPSERPRAATRITMPGYFQTMGIPLLRGRLLDRFDGEPGRRGAVINQTMARLYFRELDPLGQVLAIPMMGDLEIVGVVGDVHHAGLQAEAQPELFVPFNVFPSVQMHVVVYSDSDPARVVSLIKSKVLEIDPQQPITRAAPIEELLSNSIAQPRFNVALLIGLAGCAVVLAAVGIYAVVSYTVARRTMEIGVRMALGAGRGQTLQLIVGESMRVVLAGLAIGLVGALLLVRLVRSLLFGVTPTDPPTYLAAIVVVIVIGVLASLVPAIRATRLDPVLALREE